MDLNLLPVPQSRVELFLDYIARNMNASGNSGLTQEQVQIMINEFVKNAIFDKSTKTLSFEKEDGTIIDIDLSSLDISLKNFKKVFNVDNNVWNATYFRIPSLLRTKDGSLLAAADVRYNTATDQSFIDIGINRSTDDGITWSSKIAMENNRIDDNRSRVMDSTMLQTRSGKIILLAGGWDRNPNNWTTYNGMPDPDWNPYIVTSTDDGITWSEKVSLKNSSKCSNQPQGTVSWLGGVGTGIQMENGTLIFPIQICYFQNVSNGNGSNKTTKAGLIYSNDDGETWTMSQNFVNGTENMIVEVNGKLIMNARNGVNRASYITSDLGNTWTEYEPLHNKITNRNHGCQGSFIAFNTKSGHRIGLISTPKNFKNNYVRDNITVYMIDFDDTDKGITELLVPYPFDGNPEGAGYSSLAYGKTKEGRYKLDIVYEDNGSISYKDITFLLDEVEDIVSNVRWDMLDYVTSVKETIFTNIYSLNTTHKFENGSFHPNGMVGNTGGSWGRVVFPVKYGKTYCVTNINGDSATSVADITGSSTCIEFNTANNTFGEATKVANGVWAFGSNNIYGRKYITYTPSNRNVTHISFNTHNANPTVKKELMVWESSENPPSIYYPDVLMSPTSIVLDGDKIDMRYEEIRGLTSTKVKSALEELATKNSSSNIIGELKTLAFDSGEQFEIDGRTWLRCEGQSLSIQNYNKLYKHIRNVSKENISTFRLPNKPNYGYLYICIE